jgi:two-component system, OmpR family, response regulator
MFDSGLFDTLAPSIAECGFLGQTMDNSKHIVVVDDCAPLRETIAVYLRSEGYRVSLAADGETLREMIAHDPADIVIIDLMLPGEDGFSLTRYLREHHRCGIIMLTANTDTMNRVVGLEIGADDYVSKPHESRELLARIRSVLRRRNSAVQQSSPPMSEHNVVRFACWCLDLRTRQLTDESNKVIELTTGEFNLLREFVAAPGRVLSREQLLQAVHNRTWDYFDRSIDVLVTRLRRKLESKDSARTLIKTVRGAGYVLSARVSRRAN